MHCFFSTNVISGKPLGTPVAVQRDLKWDGIDAGGGIGGGRSSAYQLPTTSGGGEEPLLLIGHVDLADIFFLFSLYSG